MATSLSSDSIVLEALLALPNRKELQVNSCRVRNIKNLSRKTFKGSKQCAGKTPRVARKDN